MKAGVTYTLPAEDKSFQLDEQQGAETIYFMAFRQPDEDLENQYEAIVQARRQQQASHASQLPAELTRSLKTKGPAAIVPDPEENTTTVRWNSAETFTVPTKRLDGLCADCISVITFEHR